MRAINNPFFSKVTKLLCITLVVGLFQLISVSIAPGANAASTGAVSSFVVSTGGGGGLGQSNCDTGSVLYEIATSRGAIDNSFAITNTYGNCANLNDAGSQINAWTKATTAFGGAGSTPESQWCGGAGSTNVVVGARVYRTANGYASGLELYCRQLPNTLASTQTKTALMGIVGAGTAQDVICPEGTAALGLYVYYGGIVDKFGFNCGPVINATQASITSVSLSLTSKTYPYSTALSVSSSSGGSGAGAVSITSVANGTATGCSFSANTISSSTSGTCTVTITKAADLNYSATTRTETFTFNKAALTVTASSPSVNLGDPIPTITPTYSGFVNSENASSAAFTTGLVAPTCTTTYTTASTVDTSPATTCTGGSSTGYSFNHVSGRVLIISGNDNAVSLNGSNQYLSSAGAQVIPTATSSTFTIEAWVKQPASRSSSAFYQILSQGSTGNSFYVKIVDGVVRFGRDGFTGDEPACTAKVPTEAWTHVAVVVGNTSQSCYINGSLSGSFTKSSSIAIGTTFAIGQYAPNGSELFLGQIDEVKIWSTDRSASVSTDMQTYNPSAAGLTAYYDFNELVVNKIYNRIAGGANTLDLTSAGSPALARIETSTVNQAYTVVTFPRTYLVASGGWKIPVGVKNVTALLVGGGGGGGGGGAVPTSWSTNGGGGGGGGGAGKVLTVSNISVSPGETTSVTVGVGGRGGINPGVAISWGGFIGRSGTATTFRNQSAGGGGFGFGGGSWGLVSSGATTCNNTRPLNLDGSGTEVYYIDAIGGSGGVSGSNKTGGISYCDSGINTGRGTGGAGGAGDSTNGTNATNSTSGSAGGSGTSSSISGSLVTYGVGGSGGNAGNLTTGSNGNPGTDFGSGGSGGSGATTTGGTGGMGAPGVLVIRFITDTPTILTQPLSDTTTAGIVETFTITTNAVPAPLTKSVQWQFTVDTTTGTTGWTNVSTGTGGTTDAFTTAALTKSMNKYRYRAIVTFSDTSTLSVVETSTVAILTINDSITITSSTSTITRKYGETQTVRTITYSGGTTSTGAVGTSTSHTVRGSYGTLANGKIVLDTSTSTAVFRADTGTVVGSYVETITVTDFKGATATYTQRVVVNPADTLTVQADTLTAITYGSSLSPTYTASGFVNGDSIATITYGHVSCANGGKCAVGDIGPGGGVVFYEITNSSDSQTAITGYTSGGIYLEAAPVGWGNGISVAAGETTGTSYLDPVVNWCNTTGNTGATQIGIGQGGNNTKLGDLGCSSGAVQIATDLVLNGKSDWYLPSENELNQMAVQKNLVGLLYGLTNCYGTTCYWSSTEVGGGSSSRALQISVSSHTMGNNDKGLTASNKVMMRPIRAFSPITNNSETITAGAPTAAGTYLLRPTAITLANGVDTSNYVSVVFRSSQSSISRANQSPKISMQPAKAIYDTGTATQVLTATSSSATGAVFYLIAAGSAAGCSISGSTLSITSTGDCNVMAFKQASANYLYDSATAVAITFTRFVSNQPVQVQLYPTMIPLNGANSLETTTVTVSTLTISSVTKTGAGAYTIGGTGFSNIEVLRIGGSDLTGSNYTVGGVNSITLTGVSAFTGPLFIRKTDGQEVVYFQFDWS